MMQERNVTAGPRGRTAKMSPSDLSPSAFHLATFLPEVGQMIGPMMQRAEQMQKEFMAEAQAAKAKPKS
jgi:hypothetical protein